MLSPTKLAHNAETAKDVRSTLHNDAVMEPKLDGIRLIAIVNQDGEVNTYTRTGKCQTGKLPQIEHELSALPAGTILDGEIVAFGPNKVQDWGKAQSVLGSSVRRAATLSDCLTFVVFDLITFDEIDLRRIPFANRRSALERVFSIYNFDNVEIIDQIEPTEKNYRRLVAKGFEGAMVKSLHSRYASGCRGHGWYKLKATDEVDVVITGFKPGQDSFANMVGAIMFGQYRDGQLVQRGKCSGMSMKLRQDMTDHPDKYIGTAISIAHMGVMDSGKFRHPQFKRLRDDKPASECEWSE